MKSSAKRKITAHRFDQAFESGDVTGYLNAKKARVRRRMPRIHIKKDASHTA